MANVNLKTDFKNGETLFDYQLNNNFKAIEAALKAMNSIVWQDNADKVVTFRGNTEELKAREIIDGQILYNTDTGESYIDYEGKRISTGSGNAIHIGENEPTNESTQLWIDRDELAGVGSEVVNSLEGNEERMAPSVAAVNKINTYSTEETFTGKYWIDGKKIYRKVINFGALPNATVKNVLTGLQIESINIVNYYGIANGIDVSGNRFSLTLPDTHPNNPEQATRLSINTKENEYNLVIITGTDRSNYTAYIIIEYTKTTDTVEESEE